MVAALVYLQLCSWWNQLLSQARRLRQPQYLLGLLAGLAYVGFFFLRPFEPARPTPPGGAEGALPPGLPRLGVAAEHLGAGGLFLAVALTWLLPSKRAGLDFTEAEIAWLFPAPLPRRLLVHHRLLKTQAGLVFSALVIALVTSAASQGRLHGSAIPGWWILMSALELHRQAAGFTRTRLLDRGVPNWLRRVAGLAVLGLMGLLVWRALAPRLAELTAGGEPPDTEGWAGLAGEVLGRGVVGAILLPLRWLSRPLVSLPSDESVMIWLPALGMLGLLYVWALRSAVGFEDESLDRAARRTRLVEAVRTGNWHLVAHQQSERRAPFPLPPRGPRLLALTWKNLISAQSIVASPVLIALGLSFLGALVAIRAMVPGAELLKMFGAIMVGMAPMVFFMGPELARFDLRQDLPQADILKTLPLPGWQVVLGELLAPALALTILQWLMIAAAVIALPEAAGSTKFPSEAKWSIALAAALLAPALNLTLLWLHNASALFFPAWVRLGPGGAAGFEVMGQRLLLMLAHLLGLAVALLVPAVLAAAVFLGARFVIAWTLALPLAALAGALALGFQWALGLKLLGDRFERMDITD